MRVRAFHLGHPTLPGPAIFHVNEHLMIYQIRSESGKRVCFYCTGSDLKMFFTLKCFFRWGTNFCFSLMYDFLSLTVF